MASQNGMGSTVLARASKPCRHKTAHYGRHTSSSSSSSGDEQPLRQQQAAKAPRAAQRGVSASSSRTESSSDEDDLPLAKLVRAPTHPNRPPFPVLGERHPLQHASQNAPQNLTARAAGRPDALTPDDQSMSCKAQAAQDGALAGDGMSDAVQQDEQLIDECGPLSKTGSPGSLEMDQQMGLDHRGQLLQDADAGSYACGDGSFRDLMSASMACPPSRSDEAPEETGPAPDVQATGSAANIQTAASAAGVDAKLTGPSTVHCPSSGAHQSTQVGSSEEAGQIRLAGQAGRSDQAADPLAGIGLQQHSDKSPAGADHIDRPFTARSTLPVEESKEGVQPGQEDLAQKGARSRAEGAGDRKRSSAPPEALPAGGDGRTEGLGQRPKRQRSQPTQPWWLRTCSDLQRSPPEKPPAVSEPVQLLPQLEVPGGCSIQPDEGLILQQADMIRDSPSDCAPREQPMQDEACEPARLIRSHAFTDQPIHQAVAEMALDLPQPFRDQPICKSHAGPGVQGAESTFDMQPHARTGTSQSAHDMESAQAQLQTGGGALSEAAGHAIGQARDMQPAQPSRQQTSALLPVNQPDAGLSTDPESLATIQTRGQGAAAQVHHGTASKTAPGHFAADRLQQLGSGVAQPSRDSTAHAPVRLPERLVLMNRRGAAPMDILVDQQELPIASEAVQAESPWPEGRGLDKLDEAQDGAQDLTEAPQASDPAQMLQGLAASSTPDGHLEPAQAAAVRAVGGPHEALLEASNAHYSEGTLADFRRIHPADTPEGQAVADRQLEETLMSEPAQAGTPRPADDPRHKLSLAGKQSAVVHGNGLLPSGSPGIQLDAPLHIAANLHGPPGDAADDHHAARSPVSGLEHACKGLAATPPSVDQQPAAQVVETPQTASFRPADGPLDEVHAPLDGASETASHSAKSWVPDPANICTGEATIDPPAGQQPAALLAEQPQPQPQCAFPDHIHVSGAGGASAAVPPLDHRAQCQRHSAADQPEAVSLSHTPAKALLILDRCGQTLADCSCPFMLCTSAFAVDDCSECPIKHQTVANPGYQQRAAMMMHLADGHFSLTVGANDLLQFTDPP